MREEKKAVRSLRSELLVLVNAERGLDCTESLNMVVCLKY